eukprot:TRINITY_DN3762_c2_g1_i2.p1 TRINITY_DN3762_c2_g1~~TRINITY_DN3762_c2_g1_i2.p1  ORF type:complete len:210 (+),score=64.21 TRINITY_DN3762_c2_g1_i2:24-653(+)
MVLLRIDVLESKNGVCLFEKVWKWSGVSSSQGICSLVLTFFQISRDVGDKNGSVSEVLFEVPSTREKATAVYNQSTARRYIGASSKSKTKKEAKDQGSIKLKCGRGENFIIAIFHESFDDKSVVTDFVQKATALFKENHAKKISAMKKLFEEEDRSEEDNAAIQKEFMSFAEEIEPLRDELDEILEEKQDMTGDNASILESDVGETKTP